MTPEQADEARLCLPRRPHRLPHRRRPPSSDHCASLLHRRRRDRSRRPPAPRTNRNRPVPRRTRSRHRAPHCPPRCQRRPRTSGRRPRHPSRRRSSFSFTTQTAATTSTKSSRPPKPLPSARPDGASPNVTRLPFIRTHNPQPTSPIRSPRSLPESRAGPPPPTDLDTVRWRLSNPSQNIDPRADDKPIPDRPALGLLDATTRLSLWDVVNRAGSR